MSAGLANAPSSAVRPPGVCLVRCDTPPTNPPRLDRAARCLWLAVTLRLARFRRVPWFLSAGVRIGRRHRSRISIVGTVRLSPSWLVRLCTTSGADAGEAEVGHRCRTRGKAWPPWRSLTAGSLQLAAGAKRRASLGPPLAAVAVPWAVARAVTAAWHCVQTCA